MSTLSKRLVPVVESAPFSYVVMGLIALNAVVIGLETYPAVASRFGDVLHALDRIIIWIFVAEITLRWLAWTPRHRFLLDGWNLFDFIIIAVGLLPASTYLSVMRILRVLRVLRAIRVLPSMQRLVSALLKSIPALGHVMLLVAILFYIYGVIGTFLFAEAAPQYFGSLHRSFLTLFQIATLEGWPDILSVLSVKIVGAWVYVVSFILLGTYVALNLVIGVLVSNLQAVAEPTVGNSGKDMMARGDELADCRSALTRIEVQLARLSRGTQDA